MGISEKELRKIIREEIEAAMGKRLEIKEGATEDEIDKALRAVEAEEEKFECPSCGYSANAKFDKCPKCGAKVSWG